LMPIFIKKFNILKRNDNIREIYIHILHFLDLSLYLEKIVNNEDDIEFLLASTPLKSILIYYFFSEYTHINKLINLLIKRILLLNTNLSLDEKYLYWFENNGLAKIEINGNFEKLSKLKYIYNDKASSADETMPHIKTSHTLTNLGKADTKIKSLCQNLQDKSISFIDKESTKDALYFLQMKQSACLLLSRVRALSQLQQLLTCNSYLNKNKHIPKIIDNILKFTQVGGVLDESQRQKIVNYGLNKKPLESNKIMFFNEIGLNELEQTLEKAHFKQSVCKKTVH